MLKYCSSRKKLCFKGFDIASQGVDYWWFEDLFFKKQPQQVTQNLADLRLIAPLVNGILIPIFDDGIATTCLGFIYNQNIALTFACAEVKQDETLQHIQRLATEAKDTAHQHWTTKANKILPKTILVYLK